MSVRLQSPLLPRHAIRSLKRSLPNLAKDWARSPTKAAIPMNRSNQSKSYYMPLPPHIDSFQKFNVLIPDHLIASVAFGLFLESERIWVNQQSPEPTPGKCRNYHRYYLNDHQIQGFQQKAADLLANFSNGIVREKRAEFLEQSLDAYRTAASDGHRGFRGWGVVEATLGAFVWAVLLIVLSIVAVRSGIDLLEAYQKAAGMASQHQ
jgi:hypothetical protein